MASDSSGQAEEPWFEPKKMVRWFSPPQLLRTAREVVLSGIFASFSDKREIQAGIPADEHSRYDRREVPKAEPPDQAPGYVYADEVWVDYVSDLGDGFDATFTVARTLAQDQIEVAEPPGAWDQQAESQARTHSLPRAKVLIMGGDQVYPTASMKQYRDRLIGPYQAAFDPPYDAAQPPEEFEKNAPHLYSVPGNHDWYDGLTNFMRVFCQQQWIGGWKTQQSRSYFAMRLPGRWWLWGIDIQLDTYIDGPQLNFFRKLAREEVREGDAVVLCTAKPSWVASASNPDDYSNLAFFEREMDLGRKNASIKVMLAGDKHHYSRYSSIGTGEHKITAGGGGAYLSATHHLPELLTIPPPGMWDPRDVPARDFVLGGGSTGGGSDRPGCYPTKGESLRFCRQSWRFPLRNPSFVAFTGVLYLLFVWSLQGDWPWRGFTGFLRAIWLAPLLLFLLMVLQWVALAKKAPPSKRWTIGLAHGLLQGALMVVVGIGAHWLVGRFDLVGPSLFFATVAPVLAVLAAGAYASGFLTGLYLQFADGRGVNTNELFSAQRIEQYKNFLRLRFSRDGTLTIYPIGLDEPVRWNMTNGGPPSEVGKGPAPRLIEEPIVVQNGQPPGVLSWPEA